LQNQYKVKSGMKLYEQVVSHIQELIVKGVYQKGDMLPSENELTEMMGVSRITVRGALRLLNETGVIETRRGKGSFVRMDAEDLRNNSEDGEAYRRAFFLSTDARLLLEPAAAAELARTCTPEKRKLLEQSFSLDHPSAFHAALIDALGNPVVSRWFAETEELEASPMMSRMIPPARQKSESRTLESQHRQIFNAIVEGREERAYFYMKEHLEYVRGIYEDYFDTFFK